MAAESEVQKSLADALTAQGLRVYDTAPQAADGGNSADFPYVEVGATEFAEFDTTTETGFDFVARIHTRSRSAGMKECKDIQGAIYSALHLVNIPVSGFSTVLLRRETSGATRASDGSIHGICEYRGLIEKNAIL